MRINISINKEMLDLADRLGKDIGLASRSKLISLSILLLEQHYEERLQDIVKEGKLKYMNDLCSMIHLE